MLKSFISLFMMTPVSGTITFDPKRRLIVVVRDIAIPLRSLTTTAEVPGVSKDSNPEGSYAETFNVWKSLILERNAAAVDGLTVINSAHNYPVRGHGLSAYYVRMSA